MYFHSADDWHKPKNLFCKLQMPLDVLLWAIHTHGFGCKRNSIVQLHPDSFRLQSLETDSNCQTSRCDSFALAILYPSPAQTHGNLVWRPNSESLKENKTTPHLQLKIHSANFRPMLHFNNCHILLVLEFQQRDDHPSRNTASLNFVKMKSPRLMLFNPFPFLSASVCH